MFYYWFDLESFCSIQISGFGVRITTDDTHAVAQENLRSQQAASEDQTRQILHLDSCQVENVIFESGNGEIVLTGNSKVTGTITGGKIREEVQ
jgi:hypothetical protein